MWLFEVLKEVCNGVVPTCLSILGVLSTCAGPKVFVRNAKKLNKESSLDHAGSIHRRDYKGTGWDGYGGPRCCGRSKGGQ